MNSKEIFLSAMRFVSTPRLPVILLSSGIWEYNRLGMSIRDFVNLTPQKIAENVIVTNTLLNMDVIWIAAGCNNLLLEAIGADVLFDKTGIPSSVNRPLLDSKASISKINASDIENSREISNLLEATKIVAEKIGKEYLVGVSQWGPFTLAGLLFGMSKFMKMCIKDKEAAAEVIDVTSDLVLKYLNLFVQAGAELICQSDPTASGDIISPQMFAALSLPYLKKIYTGISDDARAKMLHICGNTTKVMDKIADSRADLFSVDYKVDLREAKNALAGKTALAGNLDPVRLMLEGTAEEVKNKACECCKIAGKNGGFILMPGCDIPANTPLENIQAMVEAAHKYNTINS